MERAKILGIRPQPKPNKLEHPLRFDLTPQWPQTAQNTIFTKKYKIDL